VKKTPGHVLATDEELAEKLVLLIAEMEKLDHRHPKESSASAGRDESPQDTPARPLNCWEFKRCGREPGGWRAADAGECPAAGAIAWDGTNRGKNAGRYCWKILGTLCDEQLQDTSAKKLHKCGNCDFHRMVQQEELCAFALDWAG